MVYKWIYKIPENFDDMLMNSDGVANRIMVYWIKGCF